MTNSRDLISVCVVEDDDDTREYLSDLFTKTPGFSVAFVANTLGEALAALTSAAPDVALIDIRLPDGVGLDFIQPYLAKCNGHALILSVLGDKASVLLAFEYGASGYLLKDTPPEQIIRDIKAMVNGGTPISPQAARHLLTLLDAPSTGGRGELPANILTERERDVLTMISRGLPNKEVAAALNLSIHTTADHVKAIYAKMRVHSRSEAVFEAIQNGWLNL
jgi:DNA-binding NarL/FixJ family response regulator